MSTNTNELQQAYEQKIAEYAKNPDKRLVKALNDNNSGMVQSLLRLDLQNPNISFEELVIKSLYAQQVNADIFEKFQISKIRKDFERDESLWDEDYFLTHTSYLTLNFSLERVIHLAHVKHKLTGNQPKNTDQVEQVVVNQREHQSKGFEKSFIEHTFEQIQNIGKNTGQWAKENPKTAVCIVVGMALLALFALW